LKEWVEIRPQIDDEQALLLNTFGQRLTRSGVHKIVANTAKEAGITDKRVYTHLLRHTCATNMLRSGIPITDVALQLGHRNLSSTMVYLHGDLAGLKESVDKRFVY
jgi:integrase/recombinase XerD